MPRAGDHALLYTRITSGLGQAFEALCLMAKGGTHESSSRRRLELSCAGVGGPPVANSGRGPWDARRNPSETPACSEEWFAGKPAKTVCPTTAAR